MAKFIGFFTFRRFITILIVAFVIWILDSLRITFMNIYSDVSKITIVTKREGSQCKIKDGIVTFRINAYGQEFKGSSPINWAKILKGRATLLDYADVAYNEMHQSIDRYLEARSGH